jgi:uncharacterized protein
MRILAASDIHGNHDFYRYLPAQVRQSRADAIVLAGDLLGSPDGFETMEEAQRADAHEILRILELVRVPVFYIMGNDDLVELESSSAVVQSVHGKRIEIGAYNIVGYQYTLPFIGSVFEKSEETIAKDLVLLEPLIDSHTVLLTHGPAHGILDDTPSGSAGSRSLRDLVIRVGVRTHIHGHIHECFGRCERHFNVAAGRTMKAMVVELDTLEHHVVVLGQ